LAEVRSTANLPPDALVVGSVGSLSPIKDNALLLRAAAQLRPEFPRLHVVLVGRDAGSRKDLESLADGLGIHDIVRFTGQMPQHPSAHNLFDVSVLTSVSEGLPNSVLEAMAAARPVVATRVGAVADAVVEGITGLIVPPRDPDALAASLRPLLADPTLRLRLGSAGRERARERYSADHAITALIEVYQGLVSGSSPENH
ncbi:MAG TPA: glycosyltransferase family 4 protein, partial [Longimicrobiales bacterium]|nr:glycosyltransferase family 4 protein [Longimicrobiales bacterium]